MYFDAVIIGAGAAGLMAACSASSKSFSVAVIEKMPRPGRKIMITGKGRCNFTNVKAWNDFSLHVHPKSAALRPAFYNFPPEKVMEFFERAGVPCVVERGDRAFPESHISSDIVDALVRAAGSSGARIFCDTSVESVSAPENGLFSVLTSAGSFECRSLLIATGGLSYPGTGSTGDGYKFARDLSHPVRELFPSLTALVPKDYKVSPGINDGPFHIHRDTALAEGGKLLMGCSLKNVRMDLVIDNCLADSDEGDIDFTDGGIEGSLEFRLSRKAVRSLVSGSKVSLVLDLKPAVPQQELAIRINSLWEGIVSNPRSRGRSEHYLMGILLGKLLPREMVEAFRFWNPGVKPGGLAAALKSWKFPVSGYVGYERSVVTAGGVDCSSVNMKTLESKLVPGLYFAGEVLDIDGDTGGYNLQIAFCTGHLAGLSMAARNKQ
ncbi:MAG: aminoacetone oxidase family FAD-binding enzyme [Bacteroidales bacterium]|nr:aminoacetone oxidase family FAD-binding enzyme [Bacteroidales bacterium]